MRVTVFCAGTRGDVQPFIGLGQALQRAGHCARIATDGQFWREVIGAGLEFAPLTADLRGLMTSDPGVMHDGLKLMRSARRLRDCLEQAAEGWVVEGRTALVDTDLVIGSGFVTPLALDLADERGLPRVVALLQPTTPTAELPPMALRPPRRPWPGPVNRLMYRVVRGLVWQTLRPAYDRHVRPQLGRPPYGWRGAWFGPTGEGERVLYGFSEAVVPRPSDWPAQHVVTGHWVADTPADWQPSPELRDFLAAGPPPLYVGFGSMCGHDAHALAGTVLRALEIGGWRAVLARGWGGLSGHARALQGRVLWVDQVPHDWLLPRVRMAVHHGGAGTTAACLRAGIPSVVVPFFGDQPFWAWRLNQLGVAPPALDHRTMRPVTLAAAIVEATGAAMRGQAAALGARLRAERGADRAVQTLREWGLLPPAKPVLEAAPLPLQTLQARPRAAAAG